jgi:hypothetical protein
MFAYIPSVSSYRQDLKPERNSAPLTGCYTKTQAVLYPRAVHVWFSMGTLALSPSSEYFYPSTNQHSSSAPYTHITAPDVCYKPDQSASYRCFSPHSRISFPPCTWMDCAENMEVLLNLTLLQPFYLPIYGSTVLVDLGRFSGFLIYIQSVELLGREISPSQGDYLRTEQHKHRINAHRHPCLEWDSSPRSQCSGGWRWLMS